MATLMKTTYYKVYGFFLDKNHVLYLVASSIYCAED